MTISFQCQNCGKNFAVKDEMAGRAARCKCGAAVTVPSPDAGLDDPFADDLSAFENVAPSANLPPRQPTAPQGASPFASSPNPYAPPTAPSQASPRASTGEVVCPSCGEPGNSHVAWTWWGGIIGPLIINTVACNSCGAHYNGRTGNYNTVAISIYFGVCLMISLIILVLSIIGANS